MGRVLITDDDSDMRELLSGALERVGHETEVAADGAELLTRLEAAQADGRAPDVIVSDVRMPGPDGLEVLGVVRRTDIPVILITAFGDPALHERARQLGAAAVLDKPFELERLKVLIDGLLIRHSRGG